VRLLVFDIYGNLVRTLVDAEQGAGGYTVFWDGRDNAGKAVKNGVYLCEIISGDKHETIRMMLIK
jgi:flagellar hook assembly protein FlgD